MCYVTHMKPQKLYINNTITNFDFIKLNNFNFNNQNKYNLLKSLTELAIFGEFVVFKNLQKLCQENLH